MVEFGVHGVDGEERGGAQQESEEDEGHHSREPERFSSRSLFPVLAAPGGPLSGAEHNAAYAGVAHADEDAGHDVAGRDGGDLVGLVAGGAEGALQDALDKSEGPPPAQEWGHRE